ncbi:MAG: hypothetical protein IKP95_05970 [Ruminococcus sp.]|nr:hypothetical protein [Ruminococcus sp.]
MDILTIAAVLAAGEDGLKISEKGLFEGSSWIIGLILAAVGIFIIFIGIKVGNGYRFFPEETEPKTVADELPSANAEIIDRRTTEVPDYSPNGEGKLVFKEMLIRFEAEGQSFEEWINDSGDYTDTVPVKYNPNNPQEFHVYEGDEDFEGIPDENGDVAGNEDPEETGSSKASSFTLIGVGLIVLAVGIFIFLDVF